MKLPSFLRLFGERSVRRSKETRRHRAGRPARLPHQLQPRLEGLEDRTLLSNLPAPSILDRSTLGTAGHDSSVQSAVNPLNPLKMAMVWVNNGTAATANGSLVGAFSTNGGLTWSGMTMPSNIIDPIYRGTTPFRDQLEPSIAFDRFDNVYIVWAERRRDSAAANAGVPEFSAGAIALQKYSFAGNTPTAVALPDGNTANGKILYKWADETPGANRADSAFNPVIAIDTGNPGFTDPLTGRTQGSPFSSIPDPTNPLIQNSTIYVAWHTRNQAPSGGAFPADCAGPFNPTVIRLVASNDGGANFSTSRHISDATNCTTGPGAIFGANSRYLLPQLTVSQGNPIARPDTTGAPRVPGGQLNVGFLVANNATGATQVLFDRIRDGGVGYVFNHPEGTLGQACEVMGEPNHQPRRTDYQIFLNIPDAAFVANDVEIFLRGIDTTERADLRVELLPTDAEPSACVADPTSEYRPYLFRNRTNSAGQQIPGTPPQGLPTGEHVGILGTRPNPNVRFAPDWPGIVGTTFDAQAARIINDPINDNSRWAGGFRVETGGLALGGLNLTADQINTRSWTLRVWDHRRQTVPGTPPPDMPQILLGWSIRFSGRATTIADVNTGAVALAIPAGRFTGPWTTGLHSTDWGVAPTLSMASDNTLGSFSPYQGRIYLAYTTNGLDINMITSDNAGAALSWSGGRVNDDSSGDGFSEGSRAQFSPTIAVENSTGTLVLTWYDGRHDAGRTRVARFITTSINGGATFSEQVYANQPQAPIDAITGQAVVLGPVPENMGPLNPSRNLAFGFGNVQALTVIGGRAFMAWAGNRNVTGTSDIQLARVAIAIGPRIVESTMGPVRRTATNQDFRATRLSNGQLFFFNTTYSPGTGIRQLDGFTVTFDRFVDPTSFTPDDVFISFRSPTTPIGQAGDQILATTITPLFDEREGGAFGTAQLQREWCRPIARPTEDCGAKKFLVQFDPQSRTGTYSYAVGPGIRDRIRGSGFVLQGGAPIAYDPDASQLNLRVPTAGTGGSGNPADDITNSTVLVSVSAGQVINRVQVHIRSLEHTYVPDLTITLISPSGRRVQLMSRNGAGDPDDITNLTFDDAGTSIDTWFPPLQGTYAPKQLLSAFQLEDPNGIWTLEINDEAVGDIGSIVDWGLSISTGELQGTFRDGNWMDHNADGKRIELEANLERVDAYAVPRPINGFPFTAPYDTTTLPLIIPGPFLFSSNVTGRPSVPENLVTDAAVDSLDIVFDRVMDTSTFTANRVLRLQGSQGVIDGPFMVIPIDGRTMRVGFPRQTLSGTYNVVFGPGLRAANGDEMDSNSNAGLDTLRGFDPAGRTVQQDYVTTGAAVTLDPNKTVSMPLVISNLPADVFLIQGLTVRLNISYPSNEAHNLEATLIHPDGTRILLFNRLRQGLDAQDAFPNTILDDTINPPRTTAITAATGPFRSTYNPQLPLSDLKNKLTTGTWRLEVTNKSGTVTGTINEFELRLLKPVTGTGLGELASDLSSASFRIWVWDGRNPVSRTQYQQMGPASVTEVVAGTTWTRSNRIAGIAVDPSDPSGNTVFVAGASGGLWKTTNFLSEDPLGPNYVPLTDFGPSLGINVGGVAVFGRNNDPNQSVIFLATGEGDSLPSVGIGVGDTAAGVGLLRSMDGGKTWELLDSMTNVDGQGNPLALGDPRRDRTFLGNSSFKVIVDPRPTLGGDIVAYVAMSGPRGGVYGTFNSGNTWQRLRAGQATDVAFDDNSAVIDASGRPGNLRVLYAGFVREGVFLSPDFGQRWDRMNGVGGNPQILSSGLGFAPAPVSRPASPMWPRNPNEDPVNGADFRPDAATVNSPNGLNGRIVLAKPGLTGNPLQDKLYEGWLYAGVIAPDGHLAGLYLTKDTGFNWTRIRVASAANLTVMPRCGYVNAAAPTNDGASWTTIPCPTPHLADYSNLSPNNQGNYDVSLTVDPNNPNVIYYGGLGMTRIDTTGISDPQAYFLPNNRNEGTRGAPEGRLRCLAYVGGVPPPRVVEESIRAQEIPNVINQCLPNLFVPYNPEQTPFLNLQRDPLDPFGTPSTFAVGHVLTWNNSGVGSRWITWGAPMGPTPALQAVDHHRITAVKDQITGRTRLIFGTDQGLYTAVDRGDGTFLRSIGSVPGTNLTGGNVNVPFGSRNGNIAIAQLYAGAAQPSVAAAQIFSRVRGMFYSVQQDAGFPVSATGIIDPTSAQYGSLRWLPPVVGDWGGDGTDVWTDQQGFGTVYHTKWPCCGGDGTNFFQVDYTGRTLGLVQRPGDTQWPSGPSSRFAVNPLDSTQIVIGARGRDNTGTFGRVFATYDQGVRWLVIGQPENLDRSYTQALAFGAPRPGDVVGSRNNFIYAGTLSGRIFVTYTGGGGTGNDWFSLTPAPLDGSEVMAIYPNPNRGSNEVYAVTKRGVYHMADSRAPGATWTNRTSNLFAISHQVFQRPGPENSDTILRYITSLVADFRYVLPDNPNPDLPPTADPMRTHPILYVGGEGGVFRSLDDGQSWHLFPNIALDGASREGGWLPNAQVSDLDLSLGNINQQDSFPEMRGAGTDMLYVSTYGRSTFGIRLAPMIFPQTVRLSPTLPNDGPGNIGSDRGISQTDRITNVIRPVFEGITEASQTRVGGNRVRVFLFDATDPANKRLIGQVEADEFGRFAVQVDAGVYRADGSTDGLKQLEMYAEDSSEVRGNTANFSFTLRSGTPPLPSVPDLRTLDDSGFANNDNYTNFTTPTFEGTGTPGMAVRIFANGLLVGQELVDTAGRYAVRTSTLANGNFTITARQLDLAGNISSFTAPMQPLLTIDTIAPTAPPFDLDRASDSGISNTDHITNVARPTFSGTGEALSQVTLLVNNAIGGSSTVSPVGTFSVQPTNALLDGTYSIAIRLIDRAGNVGAVSGFLSPPLTLDTVAPRAPSIPQLASGSRTGTGNTTRFSTPTFIGTGEPNNFIQVFADGTLVGQARVDPNGNYSVTTSPLLDGTYSITGRMMDVAGNLSPTTPPLAPPLIVLTGVGRPTLRLTPGQVIGGTGPNDVITPFSPQTFEGTAPINTTVTIKDPNTGTVYDTFQHTGPNTAYTRSLNLVEGRYVLVAEVRDQAGNVSTSEVLTLTFNRTALDADRRFIRALYINALGRTGSLPEWDIWVPLLRSPNGRFDVANNIERSREARTVLIRTWYQTYLGRTPNGGEEQGLVSAMVQGFTEENVIAAIIGSDEYFSKSPIIAGFAGQPTNATFITALYLQVLGRGPAPQEVAAWEAVLPNVLRGGVAHGFLASPEFRGNNVTRFYRDLLQRPTPPTAPESTAWVTSPLDLTAIRVLFKASAEYFFRQTGFLP